MLAQHQGETAPVQRRPGYDAGDIADSRVPDDPSAKGWSRPSEFLVIGLFRGSFGRGGGAGGACGTGLGVGVGDLDVAPAGCRRSSDTTGGREQLPRGLVELVRLRAEVIERDGRGDAGRRCVASKPGLGCGFDSGLVRACGWRASWRRRRRWGRTERGLNSVGHLFSIRVEHRDALAPAHMHARYRCSAKVSAGLVERIAVSGGCF